MKNKKSFVAIVLVLLIAVVGVTFAYFDSSATFENQFNIGNYNVVTQEVFTSPSDWSPGDTTPKTLIARNNGTINAAVRVKYEEAWTDLNGDEINNIPNDAVILNFTTPSKWTYDANDGYYYYNYYLKSGEATTSLIDSVTLNSNLNSASCVEENGVQTCTSDTQGLAGATYTLTFTIETIQYDKYESIWNTNIEIVEDNSLYTLMVSDVTTSNYGQYVNLGGTSILGKNNTTEADWRIFHKTNNGVWLILDDYLPITNGTVGASTVSAVGLETLGTYGIYSNVSVDDLVNKLNGDWGSLLVGSDVEGQVTVKGAADIPLWIDSWNENSEYTHLYYEYVDYSDSYLESGYEIRKSDTTLNSALSISDSTGYNNGLYFPHKDVVSNVDGYWLASVNPEPTCVYATYNDGALGRGNYNMGYRAVRPIVFLSSSFSLDTRNAVWTIAD